MFFVFKQKTAYEMRISDWSSDVCSSDLPQLQQSVRRLSRSRAAAFRGAARTLYPARPRRQGAETIAADMGRVGAAPAGRRTPRISERRDRLRGARQRAVRAHDRSEEHTSESSH